MRWLLPARLRSTLRQGGRPRGRWYPAEPLLLVLGALTRPIRRACGRRAAGEAIRRGQPRAVEEACAAAEPHESGCQGVRPWSQVSSRRCSTQSALRRDSRLEPSLTGALRDRALPVQVDRRDFAAEPLPRSDRAPSARTPVGSRFPQRYSLFQHSLCVLIVEPLSTFFCIGEEVTSTISLSSSEHGHVVSEILPLERHAVLMPLDER